MKEEPPPEPKPAPATFKMPKKVEKKPEPDAVDSGKSSTSEPTSSSEPLFKLPKKKVSVKQLPKEEPKEEESPFGKIKLKKAETVKRTWEDEGLEKVDLKHHEFERAPLAEEVHKLFSISI
jgi:hypothetical protein